EIGRSCAVLGDSLAVGAARHAPGCEVRARVGIGSAEFARTYATVPVRADAVLISLGANDGARSDTVEQLATVHAAVIARRVTWVLPARGEAARSTSPSRRAGRPATPPADTPAGVAATATRSSSAVRTSRSVMKCG
ncbi:hypothetical protein RQ765_21005, partial [Roseomonas mucosa]|uniref:hypothetical protein n=1 Tax=Roseomonas mucosa TaxID=207340 RepID=UPI0028CED226